MTKHTHLVAALLLVFLLAASINAQNAKGGSSSGGSSSPQGGSSPSNSGGSSSGGGSSPSSGGGSSSGGSSSKGSDGSSTGGSSSGSGSAGGSSSQGAPSDGSSGGSSSSSGDSGRFCHNSCYSGPGLTCDSAINTKKQLLDMSKIPYKIDKTACDQLGCTALIRYSFSTQEDHDMYQDLENQDPLASVYREGGLNGNTTPNNGLERAAPCAFLGSFSRRMA